MRYVLRGVFVFCFSLSIAGSVVMATPQIPDILIYKGREYPIQVDLLGEYFKKYPDRKPETTIVCSALWRGYVATFEFVEGTLSLKAVTGDGCGNPTPALKTVVPDGKRVAIDWYSGILLSSYGNNEADPYSLSSLDTYEKYSLFEIAAGRLGRVKHFDNKQFLGFRKRQFNAFKKTAEYREAVSKMTASGPMKETDADSNILQWMFYSYSKTFLVD